MDIKKAASILGKKMTPRKLAAVRANLSKRWRKPPYAQKAKASKKKDTTTR